MAQAAAYRHGRIGTAWASRPRRAPGRRVAPGSCERAEKIRQRLGELSPSERRVARTLLTGPPTIGLESSARLAQHRRG